MTSPGPEGFSILEVETRFLYPFLYDIAKTAELAKLLDGVKTFKGNQPVWKEHKPEPDEPYRQELLDNVSGFLFPQDRNGGCQSFDVEEAARNSWFRSGIRMSTAKGKILDSAVTCCKIELFLSPYGAGILSITLKPSATNLKDFNYYGAQLRGRSMPRFSIPRPEDHFVSQMPDPPADDAHLSQRLGFTGGSFNLGELCEFLLEPIAPHPIQGQFSLYSVVRFDRSVGFDSEKTRHELAAFLAGLAQIEERLHAGAPSGEINVPNKILNSKHWAAVSFLGAVHLIADQGGIEFDHQRLPNVMDKYFAPYLCAFLQRLTTHRIIQDAQDEVRRMDESRPKDGSRRMDNLRREMLSFAVHSNFTEVSSREALNRFYDLSREGLRVSASLSVAKEAIVDFDAAEAADRGDKNLATVAKVQSKLEWLEIFFVSFYAAELVHLVGEAWRFDHVYMKESIVAWMVLGFLLAWLGLRPLDHAKTETAAHSKPPVLRALLLMAGVLVAVLAWFGVGKFQSEHLETIVPAQAQSSSEHAGSEGRAP